MDTNWDTFEEIIVHNAPITVSLILADYYNLNQYHLWINWTNTVLSKFYDIICHFVATQLEPK